MQYIVYPNELYHHGILGQKWGKRNGPPYPLGAKQHSSSEKKAGWRKSLDKKSDDSYNKANSKRKGLTDKQKKALIIGAAATATALAAVGGYALYKSGKLNSLIASGQTGAGFLSGGRSSFSNTSAWPDSDPELQNLSHEERQMLSELRDYCSRVNEGIDTSSLDGSYEAGAAAFKSLPSDRKSNCGACTIAGIRSFFGMPTTAREDYEKVDPLHIIEGSNDVKELGMSKRLFCDLIHGAEKTEQQVHSISDIASYIKSKGNGSTGALYLPRDRTSPNKPVAHIVQWVNLFGRPIIVDNQVGIVSGLGTYLQKSNRIELLKGYPCTEEKVYGAAYGSSIYEVTKEMVQTEPDLSIFIHMS